MTNKPKRTKVWNIGSFTKNFGWGKGKRGLERLHSALNVGYAGKLVPTQRDIFWRRLEEGGYVPHIPSNFFVFNKIIDNENYVIPDELAFNALTKEHDSDFDKLALFSLFLSETGKWKGAREGQEQPSEWARFYILEVLSKEATWKNSNFTAEKIEFFLNQSPEFKGQTGTHKLATNLSFLFVSGGLSNLIDANKSSWITNALFLALDRYYLKTAPNDVSVEWAIDQLTTNDVLSFSDILLSIESEIEGKIAKLYVESHATDRLAGDLSQTIFGIISRDPLIYKELPIIVYSWLKKRIFVELADRENLNKLQNFNSELFVKNAFDRIHNKIEHPTLSGDQLLALVRGSDDNR